MIWNSTAIANAEQADLRGIKKCGLGIAVLLGIAFLVLITMIVIKFKEKRKRDKEEEIELKRRVREEAEAGVEEMFVSTRQVDVEGTDAGAPEKDREVRSAKTDLY